MIEDFKKRVLDRIARVENFRDIDVDLACAYIPLFTYYLRCADDFLVWAKRNNSEPGIEQAQLEMQTLMKRILATREDIKKKFAFVNTKRPLEASLKLAIQKNDVELFDACWAFNKVDINNPEYFGGYPIILASKQSNLYFLSVLLSYPNIDVNKRNRNGHTALYNLCARVAPGNLEIIIRLIELGADVNCKTTAQTFGGYDGETPLMAAVSSNQIDVVKELIKHPLLKINKRGGYRPGTALSIAVRNSNETMVGLLLEAGALPDQTMLEDAARNGQLDIVKRLLDAASEKQIPLKVNEALLQASWDGQLTVVAFLLTKGADVNYLDPYSEGSTPLSRAIEGGHPLVAKLLMDNQANVEQAKTKLRANDFIFAAAVGDLDRVNAILDAGDIDIDATDNWEYTALMRASHAGFANIVQRLIDAKASPNNVNDPHSSICALTKAAEKGHAEIVSILLTSPDIDLHTADAGIRAREIARTKKYTAIDNVFEAYNHKRYLANMELRADVILIRKEIARFRKNQTSVWGVNNKKKADDIEEKLNQALQDEVGIDFRTYNPIRVACAKPRIFRFWSTTSIDTLDSSLAGHAENKIDNLWSKFKNVCGF